MRVAIYARVSTKDKGQETQNQLLDLRSYAQVHGWTLYQEYIEEESGGTGNRTQFKALFAAAHQRRFDVVLFWSLDRFSREGALPTLQYLNQLESWGVGYKSYTEQYLDSTGLFKDAIVSILASIAKQEKVRISERTKAGLARTVAKGTKLGAPVIDTKVVDQVRTLKATGMSNQAISKAMVISPSTVAKYLKEGVGASAR
ncbi:recombinase family protein [Hymenobacter persicinus]|uniref:Recombinase family protein n=1 Tax=Hymenobacter persicinus TaxID=2025506 RepID=A0A4V1ZAD5_9BACT|nr:recombinase family protein [Hymenobacter persicinus]RYU77683.1 recombinase family protein [Hymenobacter persicinus]